MGFWRKPCTTLQRFPCVAGALAMELGLLGASVVPLGLAAWKSSVGDKESEERPEREESA